MGILVLCVCVLHSNNLMSWKKVTSSRRLVQEKMSQRFVSDDVLTAVV